MTATTFVGSWGSRCGCSLWISWSATELTPLVQGLSRAYAMDDNCSQWHCCHLSPQTTSPFPRNVPQSLVIDEES
jgi:hypothetical protein